jgi:hypothetical protein
MIKRKPCFNCNHKLPLFMFSKSNTPPIKFSQGRSYVCKICTFYIARDRVCRKLDNGKFVVVQLTLKERIKELWK